MCTHIDPMTVTGAKFSQTHIKNIDNKKSVTVEQTLTYDGGCFLKAPSVSVLHDSCTHS